MKPAARIQTSIEVLEIVETSPVPMDTTIGDYMRKRRFIGSKDRANIADRLYSFKRAHARIGWHLEQIKATDTPRNRALVWALLGENISASDITDLFDGQKYAPASLVEEEQALLIALKGKKLTEEAMPIDVQAECPPEYAETLQEYFGDDFVPEMTALMEAATLDIRVNIRLSNVEKVKEMLAKDKVFTEHTPYSPWGLRLQRKTFLSKTKAFVKGWIDIQDEGSQLIAYLCDAKPGMQVLDYCAGGGGKTLALACAMQVKGRIVATDTHARRLEKSRPRFRRAHVHDIIETRPLTEEKHRKWLRRQKGTFDIVLTDVPCSGTGTWRRNPDTRWRQHGPSLEELIQTQIEILDKVAKAVKPGGKLVYATCSLLPAENEEQIAAFLKRPEGAEFEILPMDKAWPISEEGDTKPPCDGDFMRLTPKRHNTDGFFAAVLQRKTTAPEEAA